MTVIEYVAYVLAASLVIFAVPGQIFFLSLSEGMRSIRGGVMMLSGVLTAEALLLSMMTVGFVIILQGILSILRIVGAVLLIWLGASAIRAGAKGLMSGSRKIGGTSYARGFLLTMLNPPFILWLLTVGAALLDTGLKSVGDIAFLIFSLSLLAASAIVTLVLVASVYGGRRLIESRGIRTLSVISGIAFIVIAGTLLIPILALFDIVQG